MKSKNVWFFLILLLAITIVFNANAWWDDSWPYRKIFFISSGSNVNDAVIKLTINNSWDYFWHFADTFCRDLRITSESDNFALPYYIEKCDFSNNIAIVHFKTNLTTGLNKYYLYFGKPSVKLKPLTPLNGVSYATNVVAGIQTQQQNYFDGFLRRLKWEVNSDGNYYGKFVKINIDSTFSDFWTHSNCYDVVFTSEDNSMIYPYYVDSCDSSNKNATFYVFLNLSTGLNYFYLYYYDYKNASTLSYSIGVYDAFLKNSVAYFDFENTADDMAYWQHHPTDVVHLKYEDDRFNRFKSAYFDGTAYMEINSSDDFDITDYGLTIAFWIKTAQNNASILDRNSSQNYAIALENGKIKIEMPVGSLLSSSTINDNLWHHVVIVFDSDVNQRKIYIDRSLDSYDSNFTLTTFDSNLFVGSSVTLTNYFIGNLDELTIWNRALNDNQIKKIFLYSKDLHYNLSFTITSSFDGTFVNQPGIILLNPKNSVYQRFPLITYGLENFKVVQNQNVILNQTNCNIECNQKQLNKTLFVFSGEQPFVPDFPLDLNSTHNLTIRINNGSDWITTSRLFTVKTFDKTFHVSDAFLDKCPENSLFYMKDYNDTSISLYPVFPLVKCLQYFDNKVYFRTSSLSTSQPETILFYLIRPVASHLSLSPANVAVYVNASRRGIFDVVNSTNAPLNTYACLFSYSNTSNSHIYDCDMSLDKLWLNYLATPKITNVNCSYYDLSSYDQPLINRYCNVTFYMYGNKENVERYIESHVYYLNGTFIGIGNYSDWTTDRKVWVDTFLDSRRMYCYRIKARNSLYETPWSDFVCFNLTNLLPRFRIDVNPKYVSFGDQVFVYASAKDPDYDLLQLRCGFNNESLDVCVSNWLQMNPYCNFTSPWQDDDWHILYCGVFDNESNETLFISEIALKSIGNITKGQLVVEPTKVKNGSVVHVMFLGDLNLFIELNATEVNAGILQLQDNGLNGDSVTNDGIYERDIVVSTDCVHCNRTISVNVNNLLGFLYSLQTSLEFDNEKPNITIISPQNIEFTKQLYFEINTSESARCFVNNTELIGNIKHTGLITVDRDGIYQFLINCTDSVGNYNTKVISVEVNTSPYYIKIISPINYGVVKNIVNVSFIQHNVTPVNLSLYLDNKEISFLSCGVNCISFNSTEFSDGIHTLKLSIANVYDEIFVRIANNYVVQFIKPASNYLTNDTIVMVNAPDAKTVNFSVDCGSLVATSDSTPDDGFITYWNLPVLGDCNITAIAYDYLNQELGRNTLNVYVEKYKFLFNLLNYSIHFDYIDFWFNVSPQLEIYLSYDNSTWLYVKNSSNFVRVWFNEDYAKIYFKFVQRYHGYVREYYYSFNVPKISVIIIKPDQNKYVSGNYTFVFNATSVYSLSNLKIVIDQQEILLDLNATSFTYNTLNLTDGTHKVKIVVSDMFNNTRFAEKEFIVKNIAILDIVNLYDNIWIYGKKTLYFVYPKETFKLNLLLNSSLLFEGLKDTYLFDTESFPDGNYNLTLIAYDNLNNELAKKSFTINILNKVLPSPYLSYQIIQGGVVRLNWTSVVDAEFYRVYKSIRNGTFIPVYETSGTQYFESLPQGNYQYYVAAVSKSGKEGNKSNIVNVFVWTKEVPLNLELSRTNLKPHDFLTITLNSAFAYDAQVNYSFSVLNLTGTLNKILPGVYQTTIEIPDFDYKETVANIDVYYYIPDYEYIAFISKQITLDSYADDVMIKFYSTTETGFEEFNNTVTVQPTVVYKISNADRCIVNNGPITEFNKTFNVYGYPYSEDYVLKDALQFSSDSVYVFLKVYFRNNTYLYMSGINCTFVDNLLNCNGTQLKTSNYVSIKVRNNYSANQGLLTINNQNIEYTIKDHLFETNAYVDLVAESNVTENLIEACYGVVKLSRGDNVIYVTGYDNVGNSITKKFLLYYDYTGAKLDVTPPTKPSIVLYKKYLNTKEVKFKIVNVTDFEQELMQLPLMYYYEIRTTSNITVLANYSNTTEIVTYLPDNYFSDGNQFYIYAYAINLAGLESEVANSEIFTVDLTPPRFTSISSPQYTNFDEWYNIENALVEVNCTDENFNTLKYLLSLVNTSISFNALLNAYNATTLNLTMIRDGHNYLHLYCEDLAGNYNYTFITLKYDGIHPVAPHVSDPIYLDDGSVKVYWWGASDNIGISFYEVYVYDSQNNLELATNVTGDQLIFKPSKSDLFKVKVRAYDLAKNPSLWSDYAGLSYDITPANFVAYGPVGEVKYDKIALIVHTDDVTTCKYSFDNSSFKEFVYDNSTYHKSPVELASQGAYDVYVICENQIGLKSSLHWQFYYGTNVSVGGVSLSVNEPLYENSEVVVYANVLSSTNQPLPNLRKSDFNVNLLLNGVAIVDAYYSFTDFGNGTYAFTMNLPEGNYDMDVELFGVSSNLSFTVLPTSANFAFSDSTIQEANYVYTIQNNTYLGVAKKDVEQEITIDGLVASSNTEFDLFVTPTQPTKEFFGEEFVNYALPMPENQLVVAVYPDVVVLVDPLLYNLYPGSHKIVVRNLGYNETLGKVVIKLELLY